VTEADHALTILQYMKIKSNTIQLIQSLKSIHFDKNILWMDKQPDSINKGQEFVYKGDGNIEGKSVL
jgi:hypothetical protein